MEFSQELIGLLHDDTHTQEGTNEDEQTTYALLRIIDRKHLCQ